MLVLNLDLNTLNSTVSAWSTPGTSGIVLLTNESEFILKVAVYNVTLGTFAHLSILFPAR